MNRIHTTAWIPPLTPVPLHLIWSREEDCHGCRVHLPRLHRQTQATGHRGPRAARPVRHVRLPRPLSGPRPARTPRAVEPLGGRPSGYAGAVDLGRVPPPSVPDVHGGHPL